MRFMFIVKSAHAGPPPPALMEAMHKLADREIKAGRMLDNGGLMPVATGAEVRIKDGQLNIVDGPFVEAKEVIGGYAILEAKSRQEAIELTQQFLRVHGDEWDIECEVRQLDGPDCGAQGRPAA